MTTGLIGARPGRCSPARWPIFGTPGPRPETRSQIIWAKNNFAIGRGHYHCKHEPCWYVVRKGSTASWVGDHCQTTLWQIDKNLKSETIRARSARRGARVDTSRLGVA